MSFETEFPEYELVGGIIDRYMLKNKEAIKFIFDKFLQSIYLHNPKRITIYNLIGPICVGKSTMLRNMVNLAVAKRKEDEERGIVSNSSIFVGQTNDLDSIFEFPNACIVELISKLYSLQKYYSNKQFTNDIVSCQLLKELMEILISVQVILQIQNVVKMVCILMGEWTHIISERSSFDSFLFLHSWLKWILTKVDSQLKFVLKNSLILSFETSEKETINFTFSKWKCWRFLNDDENEYCQWGKNVKQIFFSKVFGFDKLNDARSLFFSITFDVVFIHRILNLYVILSGVFPSSIECFFTTTQNSFFLLQDEYFSWIKCLTNRKALEVKDGECLLQQDWVEILFQIYYNFFKKEIGTYFKGSAKKFEFENGILIKNFSMQPYSSSVGVDVGIFNSNQQTGFLCLDPLKSFVEFKGIINLFETKLEIYL